MLNWCDKQRIHLVVVGPEQPLADGIVDIMQTDRRFVFGPTKAAAQLEADKAFAKDIMKQAAIPTAEGRTLETANSARRWVLRGIEAELNEPDTKDAAAALLNWLNTSDDRGEVPMPPLKEVVRAMLANRDEPLVLKATGLAAGKGVIVCKTTLEALEAVETIMVESAFGDAGKRIIIEEFLQGQEVSVLALVDGHTMWILDPCQDHKQVGEGDTGPNTGGMGAFCPAPILDADTLAVVERTILIPLLDAMRRRDIGYSGVLYAGLMLTPGGPKVLEFNCRFGDPECQPLMARLQGDLVDILWRTSVGTLVHADISFDSQVACCVVLCAEGYPGPYDKGRPIDGLDGIEEEGLVLFHAGSTINHKGVLVNTGGRVLSVTALADSLPAARERANAAIASIDLPGGFYRSDIGCREGASSVSESPATQ
jgi:phosphoribosylamine--glycine ligase